MENLEAFIVPLHAQAQDVRSLIEPIIVREGYELVWLKVSSSKGNCRLAIFLDVLDKGTGAEQVNVGDLSDIGRLLSDFLDTVDEKLPWKTGRYVLEVSSPGVERALSKRSHFERFAGKKVRVCIMTDEGSKKLSGKLLKANDKGIELTSEISAEHIEIAWSELTSANLVFEFEKKNKHEKRVGSA